MMTIRRKKKGMGTPKSTDEKELDKAMKVGKDVRTRMQSCSNRFTTIMTSIGNSKDWAWADEDLKAALKKQLQKAYDQMEGHHSSFSRRFMLEDRKQMKKDLA